MRLFTLMLVLARLLLGTPLLAQLPGAIPDGHVTSGRLSFDGHATVGDFVGTTTAVSGRLIGGADITRVRGWVAAPVRTLTTENAKRDKDLNKSMESSKYPEIRFELTGISPKGGGPDSLTATLHGKLFIHGVTKSVALPATLQLNASSARVRSDFPLDLEDYRIGGLSKMLGVLKMYPDIQVHVDVSWTLGAEDDERRTMPAPSS